MRLKAAIEAKKFDRRIREKHLARKKVSYADFKKHMEGLEDVSGNMDTVDLSRPDPAYPNLRGPALINGEIVYPEPGSQQTEAAE